MLEIEIRARLLDEKANNTEAEFDLRRPEQQYASERYSLLYAFLIIILIEHSSKKAKIDFFKEKLKQLCSNLLAFVMSSPTIVKNDKADEDSDQKWFKRNHKRDAALMAISSLKKGINLAAAEGTEQGLNSRHCWLDELIEKPFESEFELLLSEASAVQKLSPSS
jgi:hypothetical protein